MGLISGHAYTVLKIKDVNANTKLIKLRNPWGKKNGREIGQIKAKCGLLSKRYNLK